MSAGGDGVPTRSGRTSNLVATRASTTQKTSSVITSVFGGSSSAGQWYRTVVPWTDEVTEIRIGPISRLCTAIRCAATVRSGLHSAANSGGSNTSAETARAIRSGRLESAASSSSARQNAKNSAAVSAAGPPLSRYSGSAARRSTWGSAMPRSASNTRTVGPRVNFSPLTVPPPRPNRRSELAHHHPVEHPVAEPLAHRDHRLRVLAGRVPGTRPPRADRPGDHPRDQGRRRPTLRLVARAGRVGDLAGQIGVGALSGPFEHRADHDVTELGPDYAGLDDDHIDAERLELQAQAVGPAFESVLRGVVPGTERGVDLAADRGDVHDLAGALGPHVRQCQLGQPGQP